MGAEGSLAYILGTGAGLDVSSDASPELENEGRLGCQSSAREYLCYSGMFRRRDEFMLCQVRLDFNGRCRL